MVLHVYSAAWQGHGLSQLVLHVDCPTYSYIYIGLPETVLSPGPGSRSRGSMPPGPIIAHG